MSTDGTGVTPPDTPVTLALDLNASPIDDIKEHAEYVEVKLLPPDFKKKALVCCDVCQLEFSSQIVLDTHLSGLKHQRKAKSQNLMQCLEANESGFIKDEVSGVITCVICNVTVNSPQLLATHLAGSKHKGKKEKHDEKQATGETEQDTGESSPETPKKRDRKSMLTELDIDIPDCVTKLEKSNRKNSSGKFICNPCEALCNSVFQLSQHLTSKKHVEKEIAWEKMLCSNEERNERRGSKRQSDDGWSYRRSHRDHDFDHSPNYRPECNDFSDYRPNNSFGSRRNFGRRSNFSPNRDFGSHRKYDRDHYPNSGDHRDFGSDSGPPPLMSFQFDQDRPSNRRRVGLLGDAPPHLLSPSQNYGPPPSYDSTQPHFPPPYEFSQHSGPPDPYDVPGSYSPPPPRDQPESYSSPLSRGHPPSFGSSLATGPPPCGLPQTYGSPPCGPSQPYGPPPCDSAQLCRPPPCVRPPSYGPPPHNVPPPTPNDVWRDNDSGYDGYNETYNHSSVPNLQNKGGDSSYENYNRGNNSNNHQSYDNMGTEAYEAYAKYAQNVNDHQNYWDFYSAYYQHYGQPANTGQDTTTVTSDHWQDAKRAKPESGSQYFNQKKSQQINDRTDYSSQSSIFPPLPPEPPTVTYNTSQSEAFSYTAPLSQNFVHGGAMRN